MHLMSHTESVELVFAVEKNELNPSCWKKNLFGKVVCNTLYVTYVARE